MTQLVWKIRWFWDDADHAFERWLEQMAREGLHLHRVWLLRMLFIFKRGEPADIIYRTDFRLTRIDPHYIQLFSDAGWQHVDQALGWQFWRAPVGSVQVPEIFTDVESMSRKYKHLLLLFAVPLVPMLAVTGWRFQDKLSNSPASLAYVFVTFVLACYCMVRLLLRLRSLRQRGQ